MAVRNRVFHDYLSLYRRAIASTRYAELETFQEPAFADLAHGGAGTAYALWRLGDTRRAKTWLAAARADRRPSAIDAGIRADARRASLLFGRPGLHWVQAMISPDEAGAYARVLGAVELAEYACGAAGHLTTAKLVGHRALDRVIARLGTRVVEAVRTRAATPWEARDATGFAHGWPGICFAALGHAPEEAWLLDAVARLADAWTGEVHKAFVASWCNGAAGALMLWTRAFAVGGEGRVMDVARRAAQTALAGRTPQLELCCGDVGVAFALLALDRVDPRGGWRKVAREISAHAVATPLFNFPNGLYFGNPGLVCLALDLLGEDVRGFPGVEG